MNPQIAAQKANFWKININGYIFELFSFARVCVWLCVNDTYIQQLDSPLNCKFWTAINTLEERSEIN